MQAVIGVGAEYSLKPFEDVKSVWKYPLLSLGDISKIRLPELNKERTTVLKESIKKYKEIITKINYKDIFNERYEKVSQINLKEFEEGLAGTLKEPAIEENIGGIREYIGHIENDIEVLSTSIKEISN